MLLLTMCLFLQCSSLTPPLLYVLNIPLIIYTSKGTEKKNRKKKRRRFFKTFHKWSTHTNTNTFLSFKLVDISCLKNAGYTRLYGQRFFFCAPFFFCYLINHPELSVSFLFSSLSFIRNRYTFIHSSMKDTRQNHYKPRPYLPSLHQIFPSPPMSYSSYHSKSDFLPPPPLSSFLDMTDNNTDNQVLEDISLFFFGQKRSALPSPPPPPCKKRKKDFILFDTYDEPTLNEKLIPDLLPQKRLF